MKAVILKLIRHFVDPPKQVKNAQQLQTIEVPAKSIRLVSCSNVVFKIELSDRTCYFTECRMHMSLKKYIRGLINVYFDAVKPSLFSSHDKACLLRSIHGFKNYRSFLCAVKQSGSNYIQHLQNNQSSNFEVNSANPDGQQLQRLKDFVDLYLRPHLAQYYSHRFTLYGKYQTSKTNKIVATQEIAKLINAHELIPYCEYVKLKIKDSPQYTLLGVFMEEAKGICAMDMHPDLRCQKLTGKFQRSLCRLDFLDVLCHDMDHSPNNYNVYFDKDGMLEGVHVFDNNDSSAFSLRRSINFISYKNCAKITFDNGIINRPIIDNEIVEQIMGLSRSAVYRCLSAYLSPAAVKYTWDRVLRLQQAISLTKQYEPKRFLEASMFGKVSLERELNNSKVKTYLIAFLTDCKYRY